jgi:hypothetical protein
MLELARFNARPLLENHYLKAVRGQFLGQYPAGGSRTHDQEIHYVRSFESCGGGHS